MSSRPRLVALVIGLVAPLVPAADRDVWRREWLAELAFAERHGRASAWRDAGRLTVALRHALWLRVESWSLGTLGQDVRQAARHLSHRPAFASMVILTIALGVGASTALYGAARAVFWRPLLYADADRLVRLSTHAPDDPHGAEGHVSPPVFDRWRRGSSAFATIGAFKLASGTLTGSGDAEQLVNAGVTSGFFRALGVPALHGRTFEPDDDRYGGPELAVLGYRLWMRRFGGDPAVVGQSIMLAGSSRRVIGVMPAAFRYPLEVDLWVPLRFAPDDLTRPRPNRRLTVVARLADDVTLAAARAEVFALTSARVDDAPTTTTTTEERLTARVTPFRDALVGDRRPAMRVLLAAVLLVWLIGCANIAGLTFAASIAREPELAMRAALGASRGRLMRAMLVEQALLAAVGGAAAIGVAHLATRAIRSLATLAVPFLDDTRLDAWTLVYGAALTGATVILSSIVPAWRATRYRATSLAAGSTRVTGHRRVRRLRSLLVTGELAIAVALVVGAGLLSRSFVAIAAVDLGLDTARVHAFDVSLSTRAYLSTSRQQAFFDELLTRLRARPDVAAVGGGFGLPLEGFDYQQPVRTIDGRALDASTGGSLPTVQSRIVTPGYFDALGIRVLAGRPLGDDDRRGTDRVVVVNDAAADLLWPGQSPLGRHVTLAPGANHGGQVVGVVAGVREFGPSGPPQPTVYLTYRQAGIDVLTFVVRTRGDAFDLPAIRALVASLDPDVPVARHRTLDAIAADVTFDRRITMQVVGLFALAAVGLAMLGVYGVVSQDAQARVRELGIRVALGASRSRIVLAVAGRALTLAALGTAAGVTIAWLASPALRALLFGIDAADPATYAVAVGLSAAIAIVAAWLPARRAARIDPALVMRAE